MYNIDKQKRKWAGLLLGVAVLGAAVLGSGRGETEETKPQAALAVSAQRAAVTEKQQGLHLTGTVEGLTSAIISSRYSGQVESVPVENGQMVQAGSPLLKTDCQELANNVRMAENGVRKAAVNHDNIAANLAIAQKRLADATVVSPVTGVVANKNVTLGQMVSAGSQLMTVEQIDAVYVTVQVEQQDIAKVQIGKEATVKVDTYKDKTFTGKVAVINPVAGRENRLFTVKIRVENPEFQLLPGMFAEIILAEDEARPVLTVPRNALTSRKGQNYVFLVDDEGKARQTAVETGAIFDDDLEIKSGLQAGALVITDNLDKLKDGDSISVYGGDNS